MLQNLRKRLKPRRSRPFHLLQIEPTFQCGLQCVMCPWREMRAQGGSMTAETFARLVPALALAEEVDLTGGGEPTMHPRLPEMVRAAKAAGCRVGFSTNGVRLDAELAQALVDAGLDWISFSVDAAYAETYERIRQGARFAQVTANIAGLRDLKAARGGGPQMMAVFVMMGGGPAGAAGSAVENYTELPAFIDLAHELGISQVIAKNLDVILHTADDQRRLFSHAEAGPSDPAVDGLLAARAAAQARAAELGVGLRLYDLQPHEQTICEQNPLRNLFVNWQGYVAPCITLAYAEERVFDGQTVHVPCQVFGDVNRDDVEAIWNCPDYAAFRQMYTARRRWERQSLFDIVLDGDTEPSNERPPAPEGCRTCYYLYGI